MMYITKNASSDGAYSPPQSLKAKGLLNFPDEFLEEFNNYNGFVTLTVAGDTVTGIEPNVEAWEVWKAQKQDKPTEEPINDNSVYDELAAAYKEGVQEA